MYEKRRLLRSCTGTHTRSYGEPCGRRCRSPTPQSTSITYPAFPNGIALTASYAYDAAWRPVSLYTSNWNVYLVSGASYTALDQPDQWTFFNTLLQNWSYSSPLQRLSQLQVGLSATPGSVFDRSYSYDNAGNVSAITDNKNAANNASFAYDHRDRLASATYAGSGHAYSYSTIGNLTNKAGVSYVYPASGASSVRPHTPSSVGGASYTYDANGNLTGGGGRTYTWNTENLPLSVSQTSTSESYSYDADGERGKVVRGSTTTVYLEGLWEEPVGGAPKLYYSFNGQAVVLYSYSPSAFTYRRPPRQRERGDRQQPRGGQPAGVRPMALGALWWRVANERELH
jgi:hypothetical protein